MKSQIWNLESRIWNLKYGIQNPAPYCLINATTHLDSYTIQNIHLDMARRERERERERGRAGKRDRLVISTSVLSTWQPCLCLRLFVFRFQRETYLRTHFAQLGFTFCIFTRSHIFSLLYDTLCVGRKKYSTIRRIIQHPWRSWS